MSYNCYGCSKSEEDTILRISFYDGAAEQWSCEDCAFLLDRMPGMNGNLGLEYQIYRYKGQTIFKGPKSSEYNYMLESCKES